MEIGTLLVYSFILCGISLYVGYLIRKYTVESKVINAEKMANKIIEEAKKEAETAKKAAILDAKDNLYRSKADFEKETKERRIELQNLEKRLTQKEENLERKLDLLDRKDIEITKRENAVKNKENAAVELEEKYNNLIAEGKKHLEKISGLTSEEAKKQLIASMKEEARHESSKFIKNIEEETKTLADKKAKEIISTAIQRCASECSTETTVSVVNLPNEDMKGRIIGREGRNIRTLENVTGIDLIIDDTPEAVILSGYDPIKREIARISLEKLIADGRIHPTRIEEIVEKVKKEVEITIKEAGEQAAFDLGIHGLHSEIIKLVGRLKYRTSYAQNVLNHSIEVAYLCGIMAAELGIDTKIAKRAGLLHDIGKAVDPETEGSHAIIGANLAKRYGETSKIINAISAHHEEEEMGSIEAILVQAADTLSASRPGARREALESYVKRLEKLEKIADSFKGVDKSYAIQAGREVRIIVEPEKVTDANSVYLAKDIAKKIEEDLAYPGQIKITVIRETRAVDYAK